MEVQKVEFTVDFIGDAYNKVEDGLTSANEYFQAHNLEPWEAYIAKQLDPDSEPAKHWDAAQTHANKVLGGLECYEHSMLILGFEVCYFQEPDE